MFSDKKTDLRARGLITRRTALQLGGAAAAFGLGPTIARAADAYPDSPINVIIPLPPGSALDVFARTASEIFRRDMKYPFIVENVPGATSNLGGGARRPRQAGWKNRRSHGQRTGVDESLRDQGYAV